MFSMKKILVIGNERCNSIAKKINAHKIELPQLNNDEEFHNYVENAIKPIDFNKIIIEYSANAIQLTCHIRLSVELLWERTLSPIVFVSDDNLETVLNDGSEYKSLFLTKGTVLCDYDKAHNAIEHLPALTSRNYKSDFLDVIAIKPKDGSHAIGNYWGAYIFDKVANAHALTTNKTQIKKQKDLYFKYKVMFQFVIEKLNHTKQIKIDLNDKTKKIDCKNKRILYIDDHGQNTGWNEILSLMFRDAYFQCINEKITDYDKFSNDAKKKIEKGEYDLILLDLRLNGVEEDKEGIKPEDFSGVKVLRKIKALNEGSQVIIFTASNKAWNMKKLIEFGADGFYIKESPEYQFSEKFSEKNFEEFCTTVETCLKKSYLRTLYFDIQSLKEILSNSDFENSIKKQLDISFALISIAKTKEQFAYAYVSLYLIIEIINSEFVKKDSDNKWRIVGCEYLLDWTYDITTKHYLNTNLEVSGDKSPEWQKTAGLYFQKWNQTNHFFIYEIYNLIRKRNGFVHNDRKILDKKNKHGDFINHDIYTSDGFYKLFKNVKSIIELTKNKNASISVQEPTIINILCETKSNPIPPSSSTWTTPLLTPMKQIFLHIKKLFKL